MNNSILFWAGIVIFWLAFGYQRAKLSMRVYNNWSKPEDPKDFSATFIARLILFPVSSLEVISRHTCVLSRPHGFANWEKIKHKKGHYIVFQTLAGPLPLIWSLISIIFYCIFASPVVFIGFVLWRILTDLYQSLIKLFADPTPPMFVATDKSESKTPPVGYFE